MDKKVIAHFKKADPIIFGLFGQIGPLGPARRSDNLFEELCESIVSQQLSVKASDTIFNRFKDLFPNQNLDPKFLLSIPHNTLRGIGLSNAKAMYVKDLAEKVSNNEVDLNKLDSLSDQEVIDALVWIKGIGKWTAEMFLMFTLDRPNIFSVGDLGLKNAMRRWYKLENPTDAELIAIADKWDPHRTIACRVLWKSLDLK